MFIVQNKCTCIPEPSSFLTDVLGNIESATNIIVAIVGVFIAMKGIEYLHTLKERKLKTAFTFWTQLGIRIQEIYIALINDHSLINGLYDNDTRQLWNSQEPCASDNTVACFYNNTQETLKFIKSAEDQIPVNTVWLNDYRLFIQFLIDVSQYNICCPNSRFKFSGSETKADRDKLCEDTCEIMNRLLTHIEEEQSSITEEFEKYEKEQKNSRHLWW